ncbi:MAG: hypothetical protein RJA70_5032, partial [Pseudomonadota bacterium]
RAASTAFGLEDNNQPTPTAKTVNAGSAIAALRRSWTSEDGFFTNRYF